jgi:toluene monooxygenase system protein D
MSSDHVGPVLIAGERAEAIVSAIRELNREVEVVDRGAYLRVTAPAPCVVTRAAIERSLGGAFELPGDLEQVMPSFSGALVLDDAEVRWEARRR